MAGTRGTTRVLCLVHGVPGSGKTTLATALAHELGWPLVSKDAVKETLLDALGWADRDDSRRVGAAAGEVCWTVLAAMPGPAILDTWLPDVDLLRRGLDRAGFERVLEVWCHAEPDVVRRRYRERDRHPGHYDADSLDRLEEWLATARPSDLGDVVEVGTTSPLGASEIAALATRLRATTNGDG